MPTDDNTTPRATPVDALGRFAHGDRWPAVKARMQERLAEDARAEQREARSDRVMEIAVNTFAALVALLILAILAGLAAEVWRWAL